MMHPNRLACHLCAFWGVQGRQKTRSNHDSTHESCARAESRLHVDLSSSTSDDPCEAAHRQRSVGGSGCYGVVRPLLHVAASSSLPRHNQQPAHWSSACPLPGSLGVCSVVVWLCGCAIPWLCGSMAVSLRGCLLSAWPLQQLVTCNCIPDLCTSPSHNPPYCLSWPPGPSTSAILQHHLWLPAPNA